MKCKELANNIRKTKSLFNIGDVVRVGIESIINLPKRSTYARGKTMCDGLINEIHITDKNIINYVLIIFIDSSNSLIVDFDENVSFKEISLITVTEDELLLLNDATNNYLEEKLSTNVDATTKKEEIAKQTLEIEKNE